MSGHSKWASIKHKKKATDAKRGKLFTKLARAIAVAAREGGGDPDGNPALALAIDKAKQASMPKDNIQRAIDRGTGDGADADAIERIVYEGYGPGGAALLVEALSDNRNRTGSEIRHAFDRHGGNLGEPNSVAWMFEKRGIIAIDAEAHDEDDLIGAIDAGADDVEAGEDELRVICDPASFTAVREALEADGIGIVSAEVTMEPTNTVEVEESDAKRLLNLMEALDDHDDVDAVHANFEIPADVLERVAA
ncbi:MAG TPA: YebC/PmpR family DNA-binding transcriptional regulator [Solirubrobacterales bacterium]|nr:YebC/PmpR family DNA-binding transcriptional regulator [Solirubrobacterales bacterium]